MTQQHADEQHTGQIDTPANAAAFSLVGGAVGSAVGARRGVVGATVGGVVGGTVGYLLGSVVEGTPEQPPNTDDPISIDIEPTSSSSDSAAETDESGSATDE